jgi:hypothetical protein
VYRADAAAGADGVNSLYFRITEAPNPEVFDTGWTELLPTLNPFTLGRTLWRGIEVSRRDDDCAVIRFDLQSEAWMMKNSTPNQIVILHNHSSRFELMTSMSVDIGPGRWWGSLTDAFQFEITDQRPGGPIVVHGEPGGSIPAPDGPTMPRRRVDLARGYLQKHRIKRLALAYLWREHLGQAPGLASDLSSAEVSQAFHEQSSTITGWREDLASHVYGSRGHQHQIRDFVIKYRVLTWADVREADEWVRRLPSDPPTTRRPPRLGGQPGHLQP